MKLEKRTESLRDVRDMNKIPGVVFGKSIDSESIQVDEKEFNEAFKRYGFTQAFDVKLGRKKLNVILKDIQRHHINNNQILNIKLLKVMAGDIIKANLPINLIGKGLIEKPGVMVQLISDAVEVEYQVGNEINHVDLDVSKLKIGDSIKVSDVIFPEGVNVIDDLDKMLVNITETKYVPEEQPEEEVDPMDVEVITEKKEE